MTTEHDDVFLKAAKLGVEKDDVVCFVSELFSRLDESMMVDGVNILESGCRFSVARLFATLTEDTEAGVLLYSVRKKIFIYTTSRSLFLSYLTVFRAY